MARKSTLVLLPSLVVVMLMSTIVWTSHADNTAAKNANLTKRAPISRETLGRTAVSQALGQGKGSPNAPLSAGQPEVLDGRSALSAALITTLGGRGTQFSQVSLLADWDGREDFTADRAQKIDDFSFAELEIDFTLTRSAISEHTVANGFNQNVYYYGDSVGNFWIGTDTNPGIPGGTGAGGGSTGLQSQVDTLLQINIPQLVNTNTSNGVSLLSPFAGDCLSDQVIVTGIAVNPVADLGDFDVSLCGTIGEVVYVSVLDTDSCGRNAANQPFRTRIFAFAFTDAAGGVTAGGAFQILRTQFSNTSIAVDDDGSLYYHLVDLVQFTGGAIMKATEVSRTVSLCSPDPRVNRVIRSIPSPPSLNSWIGSAAQPIVIANGVRNTNFTGGASTTFGNVVAIATGPNNNLFAAVARSLVTTDDAGTQATEGLFVNPAALGPTPSMIVSFADRSGGFDSCSSPDPGVPGIIPIADGLADTARAGQSRVPGVNNFRVFALGAGPTIDAAAATVIDLPSTTLKLDMQIDFAINSGLTVDENGTVFVVSGGAPAGIGRNPSPNLGEILAFQDSSPADRRADYIDFRGDNRPNPPASGGNVGDRDSDRFDHIYWVAPLDGTTNTPTGIAGLARGFLRYTNRLAPNPIGPGVTLGSTEAVLGDDDTTEAPVFFEFFDPGHQVAGGDDQNTPFRGDDSDSGGTPAIPAVPNSSAAGTALNGGFEFSFGGPGGSCAWNALFVNSNGHVTFGAGDTDFTTTVEEFRSGPPRIAPTWADSNPSARANNPLTFPVQAMGFAGINAFKVRWINTPEFGAENCTVNASNTFSVTLSDDGVSIDENSNQPLNPANPIGNNTVPFDLQEGPTDFRFLVEPVTNALFGGNPRLNNTGHFGFDYGRMDFLGTATQSVITGYSAGGLDLNNPPGLCETNLSTVGAAADSGAFGVIAGQSQLANIAPGLIGEGTEPTVYELFDTGTPASIGVGGEVTFAVPSFDLRDPGNDPLQTQPSTLPELNRGSLDFYGLSCTPPSNAQIQVLVTGDFVTTPTTTGLINSYAPVDLYLVGFGFFPNEVTSVCSGDPAVRPGKTVTNAATLEVDTNGDGIPEGIVDLTSVTPISYNLVKATISPLPTAAGTGFPFAESGGNGTIRLNTSFSAGDNNIFGPFSRQTTAQIATGTRAPVVASVTATGGDCSLPQDLLINGSSFIINGSPNVTRVFAVEAGTSNEIDATSFTVINTNLVEARFDFGAANAGKTYFIFLRNASGFTSRNAVTVPAGAPPGAPTGNELGNLVTFVCADVPVIPPDSLQFNSANIDVTEDSTAVTVSVTRMNPTAGTVTVDYATGDVSATQKGDYEFAAGTITFGPGEVSKTISVLINEDSFTESTEGFVVNLSNPTGGGVAGAPSTITILDDDLVPGGNVLDNASDFVKQQYHDFLNRDADAAGLAFWTNQITSCGADAACVEIRRINVSAAFFLSVEFQETAGNVIRTQRVASSSKSNEAGSRVPYTQFMRDAQQVGRGVIIGQPGADALLEQNKQAYAEQIVNSAAFITQFPLALTAASYVDALFASAGVVPTTAERNAAIAAFGGGGTAGRVAALRSAADSGSVRQAELNASFVLLQYYGYLRRNPTDAPDSNDDGYQFWLNKLNSFGGNFVTAEMVKGFIVSGEYRHRFGS